MDARSHPHGDECWEKRKRNYASGRSSQTAANSHTQKELLVLYSQSNRLSTPVEVLLQQENVRQPIFFRLLSSLSVADASSGWPRRSSPKHPDACRKLSRTGVLSACPHSAVAHGDCCGRQHGSARLRGHAARFGRVAGGENCRPWRSSPGVAPASARAAEFRPVCCQAFPSCTCSPHPST